MITLDQEFHISHYNNYNICCVAASACNLGHATVQIFWGSEMRVSGFESQKGGASTSTSLCTVHNGSLHGAKAHFV